MSSSVSVLGTVPGPIHTTLLGLFLPRSPPTLWNSGTADRRKLKPRLEFNTISKRYHLVSHLVKMALVKGMARILDPLELESKVEGAGDGNRAEEILQQESLCSDNLI